MLLPGPRRQRNPRPTARRRATSTIHQDTKPKGERGKGRLAVQAQDGIFQDLQHDEFGPGRVTGVARKISPLEIGTKWGV